MEQRKTAVDAQGMVLANRQPLYQNDASGVDLVEVFFRLLSRWKILLLAFVFGAAMMAVWHNYMVVPTYQATTELYITSSDSMISLQDLQIGSALTQDYQSIIISRQVLNKVIKDLKLDTDYKGLRKLISVNNPSGTHIIRTSVVTNDLELSRDIANDLLQASIDSIYSIIGTGQPAVIDFSEAEAVADVTPSMERYMFMGGVACAALIAVFLIIRVIMDTTIKNDDDVEKYLQLPILSAVPFFRE